MIPSKNAHRRVRFGRRKIGITATALCIAVGVGVGGATPASAGKPTASLDVVAASDGCSAGAVYQWSGYHANGPVEVRMELFVDAVFASPTHFLNDQDASLGSFPVSTRAAEASASGPLEYAASAVLVKGNGEGRIIKGSFRVDDLDTTCTPAT
jgi:hypothetical protein